MKISLVLYILLAVKMRTVALKFLIVFYISFLTEINCEIFSAIEELEKLAVNEHLLLQELEVFADKVKDDFLFRKLKAWKAECSSFNGTDILRYITNPLNAFLLIKRLTADVKLIESRFPKESQEFLRNVKIFQAEDSDLLGAVEGLLRLQFFFKLKTKDFGNGIIDGEQTRQPLSLHDLFVIGEEASKIDGQEKFALEYLELVWHGLKNGVDIDNEVNTKNLLLDLISIYKVLGNSDKALEMLEELMSNFTETVRDPYFSFLKKSFLDKVKKLGSSHQTVADPFSDHFVHDGVFSDSKDRILTGQVCRGEILKTIKETSKLRCRYVSTNAFTRLARFKVEEANLDPYMILFIDVVSDIEIKFLKEASKLKKGPGTITESSLQQRVSNRRIAQISWHNKNDNDIFRKLSQRVEDMTNLSQEYAEPLQTQNYGIGGHYVGHWDCFMKWDKPFESDGNRIATVLFYLSDVEKGGSTVFPFLKLRISPRKGAAIFWYNLSSSGACDFLTRHSACPVLIGSKWVANQWIREHGNEFRRSCVDNEIYEVEKMEKYLFRTYY